MNDHGQQHNQSLYGNATLYATLIRWLKHVDVKVFYAVASIFVIPVTLFVSRGARLTFNYYRTKRQQPWLKALRSTYKNHCLFAQTVIDKFAVYAGKTIDFDYEGLDYYNELQQHERPIMQLSAHIGCSELLGYTLHRQKPYKVLVDGNEKPEFMDYRRKAFAETDVEMIPIGGDGASSAKMADAFEHGDIVGAFADRYVNPDKTITASIYGHEALLAKGVFSLAVTRGIDVVMVSAMKVKALKYKAFFTPLHYDKSLRSRQQRQQLADAYAAEIERLLDKYPEQWFNYFDLWKAPQ